MKTPPLPRRLNWLLALSCALAGGAPRSTSAQATRDPHQMEQMLKRYPEADADGDGQLTMEEARAYLRKTKGAKAAGGAAPSSTPSLNPLAPEAKDRSGDAGVKPGKGRSTGTQPDLENVPYGEHERLKLDFWRAKSEGATPILVFFHGGGGNKEMYRGNRLLEFCLQNDISAAAVNYRPNNQFPFPVPMQDAARAIQFLRSKAEEYHLDSRRVASTGTSLGANVSIWLACHDDLAQPQSEDRVLRESSRLSFVIASAAQTFNDMELYRERIYPYSLPAEAKTGLSREKAREISAIYHVTKDDPPIMMTYGLPLKPLPLAKNTPKGELIHNPAFGLLLKEKLDEAGVENYFYHGGNRAPAGAEEKFILKQFFGK